MYADLANPLRHFLPGLRAIVCNAGDAWQHGQQACCVDRCGVVMPPCIVTEKGESLDTWLEGYRDGVPAATGAKVCRGHMRLGLPVFHIRSVHSQSVTRAPGVCGSESVRARWLPMHGSAIRYWWLRSRIWFCAVSLTEY